MKIYILADMEGISGIRTERQVKQDLKTNDSTEYSAGRDLMVQDMNVAIAAAFEAGAEEVIACDTHGGGGQVHMDRMDSRAIYETPNAGMMMPSLDESFNGLILLGHHTRAGTLNGFLDHTMSSASWFEYRINGKAVGEIGIEAAYAGHFGVPVIAVTGDAATAEEAVELLTEVECAVVKWGIGRNRAKCLSLENAHSAIQKTVNDAIASLGKYKPYKPSLPATVELTMCRSDMADMLAVKPEVERVDARTVRKTVLSSLDISF